jgi:undecaprenyl-diphosphatase
LISTILVLILFDTGLLAMLQSWLVEDYYFIAKLITNHGLYLFYAVFAVLFIFSIIRNNKKLTDLCLAYLKAQLIFAFGLVRCLKILLGRVRPEHGSEFTFFSFNYRYNSFPSGHAADAFVSGVFLYYLLKHSKYPESRFIPLIFAFLIAVSRVLVNVHHPSDVAAGTAIGVLGAWYFISKLKTRPYGMTNDD